MNQCEEYFPDLRDPEYRCIKPKEHNRKDAGYDEMWHEDSMENKWLKGSK